jgi:hypothetical protein
MDDDGCDAGWRSSSSVIVWRRVVVVGTVMLLVRSAAPENN